MEGNGLLTIKEAVILTGKSQRTLYRYIKKGLLPCQNIVSYLSESGRSQTSVKIKQSDIERVFNLTSDTWQKPDNQKIDKSLTSDNNQSDICQNSDKGQTFDSQESDNSQKPVTEDRLRAVMEEYFEKKTSQLTKSIEEQSIFIAGKLSAENQFLRAKVETLLQELEQYKALPLPVAQVTEKLQDLESKDKTILLLQREKENLLSRVEDIRKEKDHNLEEKEKQIQSMEARHMTELQEREQKTKDLEELHRQEMEKVKNQAEEEQKNIVDAWKKKVTDLERPWYRRLFS